MIEPFKLSSLKFLNSYFARLRACVHSIRQFYFTIINIATKVFSFLLLPVLPYHVTPSQFGESKRYSPPVRTPWYRVSAPWVIAATLALLLASRMPSGFPIDQAAGISALCLFISILTALFSHFLGMFVWAKDDSSIFSQNSTSCI